MSKFLLLLTLLLWCVRHEVVLCEDEWAWAEATQRYRVPQPPTPGTCSLTPTGDDGHDLIGFQTKFTMTCNGWVDPDGGNLLYRLYHTGSRDPGTPSYLLYSGTHPWVEDLQLPTGRRWVTVRVENEYMHKSRLVAKVDLKAPPNLQAEDVQKMIEEVRVLVGRGEPQTAVIRAGLVAFALQDLPDQSQVVDVMKKDLLQELLQLTSVYPDFAIEENLVVVGTLVGNDPAGPHVQEMAAHLLLSLANNFVKFGKVTHLVEPRVEAAILRLVQVLGRLLALQHVEPRLSLGGHEVPDRLHEVMTAIGDLLMVARHTSATLEVATPDVTLNAIKTLPRVYGVTGGRTLNVSSVGVDLPAQAVEGDLTVITAVRTRLNPQGHLPGNFVTDFLTLSTSGEQDVVYPVMYRFPRVAPPATTLHIPVLATLSCLRSRDNSCAWQISTVASPVVALKLPPYGTTLMQVSLNLETMTVNNSVVSRDVEPPLLHMSIIDGGRHTCLPLGGSLETKEFEITSTADGNRGSDLTFTVRNSGKREQELYVMFTMERNGTRLGQSLPMECSGCTESQSVPVSASVRVLHTSEQCVRYNPSARRYITTSACKTTPQVDVINCECVGPGSYTVLSSPLDSPTLKASKDPIPLQLIILLLLVILMCALAVAVDLCDRGKLKPLRGDKLAYGFTYNVFIYTSMWSFWSRSRANFILSIRSNGNWSEPLFIKNPGTSCGQMLHVVINTTLPLGQIQQLSLVLEESGAPWDVDRVVLTDGTWQETLLFRQSRPTRVKGSHVWQRWSYIDRNAWRENIFLQLLREVSSRVPFLLTIFPAKVRTLKLDRTLSYVLGLAVWAVVWSLVFNRDVLSLSDPCATPKIPSITSIMYVIITNLLIIVMASGVSEGVVSLSLKSGERPPPSRRSCRLFPLPFWVRLVVRILAILAGVGLFSYVIFVFVSHPYDNVFIDLGNALFLGFLLQVASLAVVRALVVVVRAYYYHPRWTRSYHERLINPEGVHVSCPDCQCRVRGPLCQHYEEHFTTK